MGFKSCLSKEERSKILSLKKKGTSVHAISRELNRSRALISKFIKNPEEYVKKLKQNNKLPKYNLLNNSLDKSNESTAENGETTPRKSLQSLQKITKTTPVSNKKIIRKNYDSSKKKLSDDDIKKFNRVSIEYRAVIKYLIKKGIGPRFIYDDIKKVYGKIAPDLESILYWAKQYQQGRETIVNEKGFNRNSTELKKKPSQNTNKSVLSSTNSKPTKLFKFKFKPVKRLCK